LIAHKTFNYIKQATVISNEIQRRLRLYKAVNDWEQNNMSVSQQLCVHVRRNLNTKVKAH